MDTWALIALLISLYIYVLFYEQFFKNKVQHMRVIPDAINQN